MRGDSGERSAPPAPPRFETETNQKSLQGTRQLSPRPHHVAPKYGHSPGRTTQADQEICRSSSVQKSALRPNPRRRMNRASSAIHVLIVVSECYWFETTSTGWISRTGSSRRTLSSFSLDVLKYGISRAGRSRSPNCSSNRVRSSCESPPMTRVEDSTSSRRPARRTRVIPAP